MAQSGYTPIITYHSTTAAAVPLAANLAPGELSLNISDMKLYCEDAAGNVTLLTSAAASGTVTSVAASVPSIFSIAGSPITTSGTLAMTYSGTALPVANGGTGLTIGTSGGILAYTASGTLASSGALTQYGVVYGGGAGAAPVATANGTTGQVLTATTSGAPSWATPAASGTVTSVAATVPSIFSISGSPITTSGTLAMTYSGTALPVANGGTSLTTLTANNVILGNGASAPTFVAPSTSGNVLTSNGSTWASTALPAATAPAGAQIYTALNFGGF